MTEPEAPDLPSAGIVAALEAGVELVEDGVFTLDFRAARTKLAEFRIDEPNRFVLLLVEAAHLFPACTGITFILDNRQTRARLDGVSLSDAQLRGFLDAAFFEPRALVDDEARSEAARRMLAIALNAATGLAERRIQVDSCVGDSRHSLRLDTGDANHEVETEEAGEDEDGGEGWLARWRRSQIAGEFIELRVRDPRLGSSLSGADAETQRALIREHCWFATKAVVVNGLRVGYGFVLPDVVAPRELRDEQGQCQGLAGHSILRRGCDLELVANGVAVERVAKPSWHDGFRALVRADDLTRDLSLTEFVRSPAFEARVALADQAERAFGRAEVSEPLRLRVYEQANHSLAPRVRGRGVLWSLITRWLEGRPPGDAELGGALEAVRPGVAQLECDAIIREWQGERCQLIVRMRVFTRERPPFAHALRVLVDEDLRYALHEGATFHVEVSRAGEVTIPKRG